MALYLSITILPNPHTPGMTMSSQYAFLSVEPNVPWIYAYSDDRASLEEFKARIELWTPALHLQYMKIDIHWTDTMPERMRLANRNHTHVSEPIDPDWFYLTGCINNERELRYRLEDFTFRVWRWWPEDEPSQFNVGSLESIPECSEP